MVIHSYNFDIRQAEPHEKVLRPHFDRQLHEVGPYSYLCWGIFADSCSDNCSDILGCLKGDVVVLRDL